ncbi:MAG: glycoside hydrolase family 92, partial [Prevotellaceae bacterium]|nr:glycoside hydrolase family 92 [Prevotellaceae bacterium]
MKRLIFSFCLLVVGFAGVSAQKFIHPGVLHTGERIKYMRILVEEQVQPAYGSWLLLKENNRAQADYKMQGPFRVISRDGAFGYTK